MVLTLVTMGLFPGESVHAALRRLVREMGAAAGKSASDIPGYGAIGYRRSNLGSAPMKSLFQRVCQPLATERTRGAFLRGLRLMVIDGHVVDVADSPQNEAAFGRHTTNRGAGTFPQIQSVLLCEAATRAIVDAVVLPCHGGEHDGAQELTRSLTPRMLVMADRGLHSYELVARVQRQGADVLFRLSSTVKPRLIRKLCDGTSLCSITPSDRHRKALQEQGLWMPGEQIVVRIIEYVITDADAGNPGEVHRLLTTLLDPQKYPALELAGTYHQRWHIETAIREVETVQRLSQQPLLGRLPHSTLQEFYALLIAHYMLRALIHEAALQADVAPICISFKGSLHLVGQSICRFQIAPVERHRELMDRLIRDIADQIIPFRPPRHVPRQVKRQHRSHFPVKKRSPGHSPAAKATYEPTISLFEGH